MMKSKRMGWEGHAERMRTKTNTYRVLVESQKEETTKKT
jgi:hypothetical protein